MAQFEKRFVQDLTQDIKIQQGGTIVFNNDNLSNVVGVALYNGKVPASVSGTVVGAVIAPDGATVPVDNGTISGNTVSITLTRACFALPGNIGVGIQVVTGDVATTVLKVIYNVELFSTDTIVDPDSRITLSLAEIQAKLDEIPTILANAQTAIDGIEAQKDTMIASIASVAGQGTDTTLTQSGVAADAKATGDQVRDLKSAIEVIGEKAPNLYDADDVILGKNWAGGDAANRAYIQIPVTAGKTYTVVIPTNVNIPQVAVIQLNSAPASLGSFYVTGGNRNTFTAVTNCVNIRIQFEGSTTLAASDFENYDVQVFEGSEEYFSAVDKIARSKLPIERKYIFIGDSYCEGYNPDGNVTGWGERLKTAMGLTNDNCIIKYKGGTGFYHVSDGKTFSTLLDEAGTGIDKTTITDIIVCGGWNDNSETLNNVYFNGVLAFATKVATEYPNATLYVGMIGASNDADVKSRLQSVVLYSYQYGALRKNYRYLNMVEYALSEANLASDGIHPNADGQVEITIAIKQALETGCAGLPYRFYNTIKTN